MRPPSKASFSVSPWHSRLGCRPVGIWVQVGEVFQVLAAARIRELPELCRALQLLLLFSPKFLPTSSCHHFPLANPKKKKVFNPGMLLRSRGVKWWGDKARQWERFLPLID